MMFRTDNPTLYKFFYRNLQQVFKDLNILPGGVLEYIAYILTHFARTTNLYRIKQLSNFQFETITKTLLEIEERQLADTPFSANEEMLVRKHIGDFTLFMSGIFREYIKRLGILDFYLLEGGHSYRNVFEYTRQEFPEAAPVFHQLSHNFEHFSGALDYMKKVYFYCPDIDDVIHQTIKNLLAW